MVFHRSFISTFSTYNGLQKTLQRMATQLCLLQSMLMLMHILSVPSCIPNDQNMHPFGASMRGYSTPNSILQNIIYGDTYSCMFTCLPDFANTTAAATRISVTFISPISTHRKICSEHWYEHHCEEEISFSFLFVNVPHVGQESKQGPERGQWRLLAGGSRRSSPSLQGGVSPARFG